MGDLEDLDYDPNEEDQQEGFELLPPAWYDVYVGGPDEANVDASPVRKESKTGNGDFLQITWIVAEGPFKGRRIWDRLNLWNRNEEARDIARKRLSSICHALEYLKPLKDSGELIGRSCRVKVRVRKGDNGFEDSNEIVNGGYERNGDGAPPRADGAKKGSGTKKNGDDKKTPPWQRK